MKYLIIGDVHGRDFWREPVKETLNNSDFEIIFLGDFLDCYPFEWDKGFDYETHALENFKEIIQLKKDNPDRIILLLGNHDCTYAIGTHICDCRRDKAHYEEIANLFKNNRNLLQLAKEDTINGKHFIFSHAGILKGWVERVFGDEMNEDGFNVVNELNKAWETDHYGILNALGIYDSFRGWGGGRYGSPVWADIRSWADKREGDTYGYNIVGHTYLRQDAVVLPVIACLDSQKAFYLDDEGNIRKYDDNKIIDIPKI